MAGAIDAPCHKSGQETKLEEERKKNEEEFSNCTAIILKNDTELSNFASRLFGPIKKSYRTVGLDDNANMLGYNDGKNTNLNKQIK